MAYSLRSQPTEPQRHSKAREILNGMSRSRIDPSWIKTRETKPRTRGGQGTVVVGTIIPPEVFVTRIPEEDQKTLLETQLAIKKFEWDREDAEASAKFFNSFANELSIMASLSHPNVVEFVGFVEDMDKGDAWIVLSWEPNGNVREFLASGEWDIPERLSLIQDVAKGVDYLHTRRPPICHGDLKSLNILVSSSYHALITDFGSARAKGNVDLKTEDGGSELPRRGTIDDVVQGLISPKIKFNRSNLELTLTGPGFSLRWTAPEVLNNGVQDLPSDLWALGWICWEIFTGKIPFEELSATGPIISTVIKGNLPAIREDADLSCVLSLCSLMMDCWMSNSAERIDASTFRRKVGFMVSALMSMEDYVKRAVYQPSSTPSVNMSGGAKVRSAALLYELGKMYRLQDNGAVAKSYFQSAIEIATRTKDEKAKANALEGLGTIYRAQSRYQEAEKSFMEAHEIHSRIGNDLGAANAFDGLGETYRAQSREQDAEKAFMEAHEIYSRSGQDLGVANTLHGLGEIYYAQSRNQDAEKAFIEAHEIHSRIGNDLDAANALRGLGNTCRAQSKYQEAEKASMEAHRIYSRIGDNLGAANALLGLGNTCQVQSRYQEAEKASMEAHKIYSRIGDDLGAANALLGLGNTCHAQSKYQEAEKAFMEAHKIHSRIGNDLGVANALGRLGEIYRAQSRNQEAEKASMEAHEIYSRIGDDLGAANALLGLGNTCHAQSRYQEAEKAYIAAHKIHSLIGNDLGAANAFDSLGETYRAQSRNQDAEKAFMEALEIHSRIGNDQGAANALLGLGNSYRAQSKNPEAENALNNAHNIYSRIGYTLGTGDALRSLAMLYSNQNRPDAAAALYHQAAAHDPLDAGTSRARTLLALGRDYHARCRYFDAEEAASEALAIWISTANENGQAGASLLLAMIFKSQSRHDEEKEALIQAGTALTHIGCDGVRAVTLNWIGDIHLAQSEYGEAEECYRLAQAIYSSLDDICGEATELGSLGRLYGLQDRHDKAVECFAEARAAYARGFDKEGEAKALDGLAAVYALQRKLVDARVACMEAREIYAQMGRTMSKTCAGIWEHLQALE